LRYALVHALKRDRPELTVVLNGGLADADSVAAEVGALDGVMIGRAAYHDPYLLTALERLLCDPHYLAPTREAVMLAMRPYLAQRLAAGDELRHITRHLLGLYQGMPNARRWRQILSVEVRKDSGLELIDRALAAVHPLAA
jgi:tRNA-dihydrouridine synthase A